ncbi:MAG TPA: HEAT repeat domain-containing protein, partial [Actinomycetota bacterium]|nr:HEAT repeat domain-containing protein [Actinomycetota bacterium]
ERRALSGSVPSRLEALDGLARSRIPSAMPTLIARIEDPERVIQVAAARAAARTLAMVEDPVAREETARALVGAVERARLPFGVLEEMLLLADDGAPSLVGGLLFREGAPAPSLRAALDAVARLQLLVFAEEVARFLSHPDPEVRAAALRAVARTGLLPPYARLSVLAALQDEVEFIRIHATSAARLLPSDQALETLWARLGDRSWWVRRSASEALASLGRAGLAQLGRAARSHPDRYARDMAAQALRDRVPDLVDAVTR